MANTRQKLLAGWGNVPMVQCAVYRPEWCDNLPLIAAEAKEALIARGQGRAYGDAALNPYGVVCSERLNRILYFDTHTGILRAEAGVTLGDILDVATPQGWLLPVIPGTRHASIGGALACNIHGKNHFRLGNLSSHVLSCSLLLADGRRLECSPDEDSALFWATAGGMGMTGIIEDVTVQLKKIDSLSLRTATRKVESVFEMVECFYQAAQGDADYAVGWIDHFANGESLGRGVFEQAWHITVEEGGDALRRLCTAKDEARRAIMGAVMDTEPLFDGAI